MRISGIVVVLTAILADGQVLLKVSTASFGMSTAELSVCHRTASFDLSWIGLDRRFGSRLKLRHVAHAVRQDKAGHASAKI